MRLKTNKFSSKTSTTATLIALAIFDLQHNKLISATKLALN